MQSDPKFPLTIFPSVPWCVEIGQAYNQLAVLSSNGCQLGWSVSMNMSASFAVSALSSSAAYVTYN